MALVLVTGGTGFIGSHIVAQLLKKGHRVAIMSRNPGRKDAVVPPGVEVRQGDIADTASLERAMAGVDVVINAVQFPNHPVENPGKGHTYLEVDGEGTRRQVEAAQAAGVRRFVYLSGAGVRADQTATWFRAKLMAEKAVRESGLEYTIFRPSWVYGAKDRSLNRFVNFARWLPFIPVIGNGKGRVQLVHVEDLAEVVAASVSMPRAAGQVYDVGGPQALSMDEIIQTMLRVMGKRRPLIHHPVWFMKLVTAPLTLLPNPPLSPAAVDFIVMEEQVDTTALLRDFAIKLTPLEQGLRYLSSSGSRKG